MRKETFTFEYRREILFWIAMALLFVLIALYGYLVNTTIVHIVDRKAAENNTATVLANISELEAEYLGLKKGITREFAYSLGFKDPKNVVYVIRGSSAGLASRD